ncbi:MAG: hypothetical protein GEV07_10960 [Streptosporangiales bacterium]|nr:hypothetical protein [Streptosporangiales bacterium]
MPDTTGNYTGPPPVARSPITTVAAGRGDGALTLTDESSYGKLLVRAAATGPMATALGTRFGRTSRDAGDEALVVGSGPGEWLLLADVAELPKLTEWLEQQAEADPDLVSIVDATHGRAMMRLTGHAAADVLAKLCAVDLSDTFVPDGGAFRSSVTKLVTDVVRDDAGGASTGDRPSYLLHCERSSGQYLWEAVADAGLEYGLTTTAAPT